MGRFCKGFRSWETQSVSATLPFPLLNNGTLAIQMCFSCLYLATAGGGPYSLDAMMGKKSLA